MHLTCLRWCHAGLRKTPQNRVERHKAEEQAKEPDHEKAGKVDGTPVGQPVGSAASVSQCPAHTLDRINVSMVVHLIRVERSGNTADGEEAHGKPPALLRNVPRTKAQRTGGWWYIYWQAANVWGAKEQVA